MMHTLKQLMENNYNPFDLICYEKNLITQFSWNGQSLSQQHKEFPFFISSSSVDTQRILKYREELFLNFKAINSYKVLNELHLVEDEKDKNSSIFMSRKHTHTKSVSQITITKQDIKYSYFNENELKELCKKNPQLNHTLATQVLISDH